MRARTLKPNALLLASLLLALALAAAAQRRSPVPAGGVVGEHTLIGDLKIDDGGVAGQKPVSFEVVLYNEGGNEVTRQTVSNGGRYRFLNLPNGSYDVAVVSEGVEVARARVRVESIYKNDFRQDLQLAWRERPGAGKARAVSAADFYKRTGRNQELFTRADEAIRKPDYERAAALLAELVAADSQDYQAWTELGTVQLFRGDAPAAEQSYLRALREKPAFPLALVNLGRLRAAQKNFDGAVEVLTKAVEAQPDSADANYLLGEAYLQLKQGSKAVPRLTEAIRLGKAEGHLRLAALYHAAGLRDRAAAEYEQFLAKQPAHPDRKKFEQYVKENRKK
jgi:tetratricopeptide (TPR) repeat protein